MSPTRAAVLTLAAASLAASPAVAQDRGAAVMAGLAIARGHPVGPARGVLGAEIELTSGLRATLAYSSWSLLAECADGAFCGRDDHSWEFGLAQAVGPAQRVRPFLGVTGGVYRDGRSNAMLGLAAGADVRLSGALALRLAARHHELLGEAIESGRHLRFTGVELQFGWNRW